MLSIYLSIYLSIDCLLDFCLSDYRGHSISPAAEILIMLEVTYALSNSLIKQHYAASPLQEQYE